MGPQHHTLVIALLALVAAGTGVLAAPMATETVLPLPARSQRWLQEAEEFERLGQWDRAVTLYVKLLALDRDQPAIREHLVDCLRHLHQTRRHRDPTYLARLRQLAFARALGLYSDVVSKVHTHYVDPERSAVTRLFQTGLDEFVRALADEGFRQAHLPMQSSETLRVYGEELLLTHDTRTLTDASTARQAVRGIALTVQRDLGLAPAVTAMEFVFGACNGLDEYSGFLPPDVATDEVTVADELISAGIGLAVRGGEVLIDRIVPGSWAEQAFLREGDRVTRLAGKSLHEDLTADSVAALLGMNVTRAVRLDVVSMDLPRSLEIPFDLPTTTGTAIVDQERGIGYTRLLTVGASSLRDLDDAIVSLQMQGMRVLVLDLRGNPGGLVTVAVQLAERFLPAGVIASARGHAPGTNRTYSSRGGMGALNVPLVLLIDGETASAAEVLAGACKDHDRAVVVGMPSYGKGSIQVLMGLSGAGSVRLTLARLFTPQGLPLTNGVTPHISEPIDKNQLTAAIEAAARLVAMQP